MLVKQKKLKRKFLKMLNLIMKVIMIILMNIMK